MHNITQSNLTAIGLSQYYITAEGILYNITAEPKEVKKDKTHRYYVVDDCGRGKRITQKELYRIAYNKEFSIDRTATINNEEWKEIPNTNGKYFISNCGRVKSLCGYTAKILKPHQKENGYLVVRINKKSIRIHRLVAFAFCENKYNKQKVEIHHTDRNRSNNNYKNLEILLTAEHHEKHKKGKADNENILPLL